MRGNGHYQQHGKFWLDTGKKFWWKGSRTAQKDCVFSVLGNTQRLTEYDLEQYDLTLKLIKLRASNWTTWYPEVPTRLLFYDYCLIAGNSNRIQQLFSIVQVFWTHPSKYYSRSKPEVEPWTVKAWQCFKNIWGVTFSFTNKNSRRNNSVWMQLQFIRVPLP